MCDATCITSLIPLMARSYSLWRSLRAAQRIEKHAEFAAPPAAQSSAVECELAHAAPDKFDDRHSHGAHYRFLMALLAAVFAALNASSPRRFQNMRHQRSAFDMRKES